MEKSYSLNEKEVEVIIQNLKTNLNSYRGKRVHYNTELNSSHYNHWGVQAKAEKMKELKAEYDLALGNEEETKKLLAKFQKGGK